MKLHQGTVSLKLPQKIVDTLKHMRQVDKRQFHAMVDQKLIEVKNLLKDQGDLRDFNKFQPE